jgi:hypothetical protein
MRSSDGKEQFDRMSDLYDISFKMEVINNRDETYTELKTVPSSRAKLKNKYCSPITPPSAPLHSKHEEFCDLQIRLLEAQAQQGGAAGGEGDDHQVEGLEEMVLQPGPVMLTWLGWGPSYGAVACRVV